MGDKTKIDWCDATWNPITGCLHGCEYCYARGIAHRYGLPYAPSLGDPGMEGAAKWDSDEGMDTMLELEKPYIRDGRKQPYPMGFLPTFHRYRLDIPAGWQRPRNIFVCSMADMFGEWVPDEWIQAVFDACRAAPRHRYMFLTKAPERFKELLDNGIAFPENSVIGTSVTRSADAEGKTGGKIDKLTDTWPVKGVTWFVSVEPILENLSDDAIANLSQTDWVIIGAETGQRKDKVIPDREWIERIVKLCHYYHKPVFMKGSLRQIMGDDFIQEYPWEATT